MPPSDPVQSPMNPAGKADGAPVVRCILWHAKHAVLPGSLIAAIDRPTMQWKAWDCDLLALSELFRPDVAADALTSDARAKVLLLVDPARLAGIAAVLDTIERYRPATLLWVYEGGATPRLGSMQLGDIRRTIVSQGDRTPSIPVVREPPPGPAPLRIVVRTIGPVVPKVVAPRPATQPTPLPRTRSDPLPLRLADNSHAEVSNASSSLPRERRDEGLTENDSARTGGVSHQDRADSTLLSEEELEMLLSESPPPSPGPKPPFRGGKVR